MEVGILHSVSFHIRMGIRNGVLQNAHIHQLAFNKWDIIIEFLHDPFLVIYFLLPFWLFYSSQMIMKEKWDYMLLIRLKSYTKWVFYTFKKCLWFSYSFSCLPLDNHQLVCNNRYPI